jgi:nitrogen fixation protein FixH
MTRKGPWKLTGRDVFIWLFGFFAVIFAMNIYFIMVSTSTFRGEDEQKPYLQGVAYNQTLARRAEQMALGWKAAISATRLSGGNVRIEMRMMDRDGRPVKGPELGGELRHPADENRDRPIDLKLVGPGTYQAELAGISPGAWDVLVRSRNEHVPFEAERRLWLR